MANLKLKYLLKITLTSLELIYQLKNVTKLQTSGYTYICFKQPVKKEILNIIM